MPPRAGLDGAQATIIIGQTVVVHNGAVVETMQLMDQPQARKQFGLFRDTVIFGLAGVFAS